MTSPTHVRRRRGWQLVDQAVGGKPGRPANQAETVSIRNNLEARPIGTTRRQALRRLRTHRPELHTRVLAGELSPHAAMLEAGFRRRTITVDAEDPERAAAALEKNLNRERFLRLAALLAERARGIDLPRQRRATR